MYANQPRVFQFLQGCLSVQLWKHGCSQRLLQCLQNLGVSKGPKGTIGTIDRVRRDATMKVQSWKAALENKGSLFKNPTSRRSLWNTDVDNVTSDVSLEDELQELVDFSLSDTDNNESSSVEGESLALDEAQRASVSESDVPDVASEEDTNQDEEVSSSPELGYAVVWDNVQIQSTARHQSRSHQNKFRMWALTFAAQNRVPYNKHQKPENKEVMKAQDVPLSAILPSATDWDELKERMIVILEPILKLHLTFLAKTNCTKAAPHQHMQEVMTKSEI